MIGFFLTQRQSGRATRKNLEPGINYTGDFGPNGIFKERVDSALPDPEPVSPDR